MQDSQIVNFTVKCRRCGEKKDFSCRLHELNAGLHFIGTGWRYIEIPFVNALCPVCSEDFDKFLDGMPVEEVES